MRKVSRFTIAKHAALNYDGVELTNGARLEVDPGTQIIENEEGTGVYALAWVYLPNKLIEVNNDK